MAYKVKSKKVKEKNSFAVKKKNLFLKVRKVDNPYEVWKSPDGTWETRVLKKWQIDDNKPYARYFTATKSPFTHGSWEYGDMYVSELKKNLTKQDSFKEGLARDKKGDISNTTLSPYGMKQLTMLDGAKIHFKDGTTLKLKGNKLITDDGKVFEVVDSDRKVNKIIFAIM